MPFIAQISDLHVGSINFVDELLVNAINDLNEIHPDVTIVTGDITDNGYFLEYEEAVTYLDQIKSPILVVPGNHDARHVGDECFEELIKNRYISSRYFIMSVLIIPSIELGAYSKLTTGSCK